MNNKTDFPNIDRYIDEFTTKRHCEDYCPMNIILYCRYAYSNSNRCENLIADFLSDYDYYDDFCNWGHNSRWKNVMAPCAKENADDFIQLVKECVKTTGDVDVDALDDSAFY